MRIKNNTASTVILVGTQIAAGDYYTIQVGEESKWRGDDALILGISNGSYIVNDGVIDLSAANGLRLLAGNSVIVQATPPFAEPTFRTKRDKTYQWTVCPAGQSTVIDFLLTAERYVTGGKLLYKNAKEGDYITAEIYDKDSTIPAPYRAALCENWPSVASYLTQWVCPTETDKYSEVMIDTYPLNAKITAGLYLRLTYHASSEAGDRKAAVNYHLTKKL